MTPQGIRLKEGEWLVREHQKARQTAIGKGEKKTAAGISPILKKTFSSTRKKRGEKRKSERWGPPPCKGGKGIFGNEGKTIPQTASGELAQKKKKGAFSKKMSQKKS